MPLKTVASLFLALSSLVTAVEVRLATFNIGAHLVIPPNGDPAYFDYGIGDPGLPDHENVRAVLGRIDADVVALQEIHSADVAGTNDDLDALAAALGYPHIFVSPSTNTFDTSLRVVFVSRFPFLTTAAVGSPAGARDVTRLFPTVKVDVPGTTRDPVLVAAHLKSGSAASDLFQRTVEMRRLTDSLSARGLTSNDNFVIMGDFNLSGNPRPFDEMPLSGLPASFDLGSDIAFPIDYFTDPTAYFSNPAVTRIIPRQLNNSTATFPSSGSTIDLFLVSPIIGARPIQSEIYNSTLDTSNTSGLPKSGSPLAAGTSAAASDHFALFGDFELDSAAPYTFTAAGQTIGESFAGFPGTYDPYPWATTGGTWQGIDAGTSSIAGFRAYGSAGDPSLGFLPGTSGGTATAFFVNQSTQVLSTLEISFTAEQWRAAGGTADTLSAELVVGGAPQPLPGLTFQAATNLPGGAIAGGKSTPKSMTVTGLAVAPGASFELRFTFTPGPGGGGLPADVFINEFSYDNAGADTGEFLEVVAGPGFAGNLTDVDMLLYNGSGGATYGTHNLSTFTAGAVTASGHRSYSKLISGIQNGNPDGFALTVGGVVKQFISYGGAFQATAGAANGMTSTNIGVTQLTTEVVGQASLGLTGTGGSAATFTWTKFTGLPHSLGQANLGQTFTLPPQPQGIAIDNLAVTFISDSDGDGFTDAQEMVFGTDPQNANSRFMMTFTAPTAGMARLTFPTLTGRSYAVQGSVDLTFWSDIATYPGTGGPVLADIPVDPLEPARFYRIRATAP